MKWQCTHACSMVVVQQTTPSATLFASSRRVSLFLNSMAARQSMHFAHHAPSQQSSPGLLLFLQVRSLARSFPACVWVCPRSSLPGDMRQQTRGVTSGRSMFLARAAVPCASRLCFSHVCVDRTLLVSLNKLVKNERSLEMRQITRPRCSKSFSAHGYHIHYYCDI